ncbi:MAG: tRNA (adenosine(37)-N6)-threonylcarbamoyltransferase complex dimerization subunit type 1 TsaB, partial [Anaerovorax sp.]
VALIDEKGIVFEERSEQRLNHLQNLMTMIDKLLTKCAVLIGDVTCIAVSEGPGSFTGIRIGVSSARALAQCLGIKTIGVPTLKTFAYAEEPPAKDILLCPIFDARRNQVYSAAYSWEGCREDGSDQWAEKIPANAYELEELLTCLEPYSAIRFFGDGIEVSKEKILAWVIQCSKNGNPEKQIEFAQGNARNQHAAPVAKLAYELYKQGRCKSFFDLKPVYLRKAEAQRKLEDSLRAKEEQEKAASKLDEDLTI